jgi:hypothetical protein
VNEFNENGFSEENLRRIAALKIKFRLSVKIHLIAYILGIVLLISINMLFTPFLLWVIFVIFGWLIGLVMHLTAYIVYARGVYPVAKRGVIFNTVAYIVVILFLFIINDYTNHIIPDIPYNFYWSAIPAFFWGLALIIHYIIYLGFFNKKLYEEGEKQSRMERAIEKEMHKLRKKST